MTRNRHSQPARTGGRAFRFACAAILAAIISAHLAGCSSSPVRIVSPEPGATVPTLSDGQKAYLAMPRAERVAYFADQSRRNEMKALGYYPLPTRIEWAYEGDTNETPSFDVCVRQAGRCVLSTNLTGTSLVVDNLEIARKYDVTVSCASGKAKSSFTTEDQAPRLIRIPRVPNVRDLGGRIGLGGRRIRQGLVYRSAGLNENATAVYYTTEELAAREPHLKARSDAFDAEIAIWNDRMTNAASFRLVGAAPGDEWTLFMPQIGTDRKKFREGGWNELAALREIPAEFMGAKAGSLVLTNGATHFFPKVLSKKGPAILMQVVEAPEDGYMPLAAGGDYWWCLASNGEAAFDLLDAGNWPYPYSADCFVFPVPVKKGRNLVSVVLFAGDSSFSWGYTANPGRPAADFCKDKIRSLRHAVEAAFPKKIKSRRKGADRLTPQTRAYMTQVLGIRSDIDLRSDGECYGMKGSPLGDGVAWFHYSSAQYGKMQLDWGREAFAKVFKVFLDPANYPIDFHCIAGQDRTGAVAFILGGLLGMDEEDLYRDWETTGFWNGNAGFNHKNLFDWLVAGFKKWPGETINDRIEAYVLSLGFTGADIEKFRSIMLE